MTENESEFSVTYKNYSSEQLQSALNSIKTKQKSLRGAAKHFDVPQATLSRIMNGKKLNKKPGPEGLMSVEEEDRLKNHIFRCARAGVALNARSIIETALYIISSRKDPTKNASISISRSWVQKFLKRHDDISKRTPEMISKASATVTKEDLLNFYDRTKQELENDGNFHILHDPRRVIGGDESGFALNPEETACYAEKGMKNFYQIANNKEKVQQTVLYNFSASGEMLPPFILYKKTNRAEEIAQKLPGKNNKT